MITACTRIGGYSRNALSVEAMVENTGREVGFVLRTESEYKGIMRETEVPNIEALVGVRVDLYTKKCEAHDQPVIKGISVPR